MFYVVTDRVGPACDRAHAGGQVGEGGEEDQYDQEEGDAHNNRYADDELPK